MRGWGRGLRRAVASWYTSKDADALAHQVRRYRQRGGWTHRDLLRLSHPKPVDEAQRAVFELAVGREPSGDAPRLLEGFRAAQSAEHPAATARLVIEFGLTWEMLRSDHLTSPAVWQALLDAGMPQTALLRHLPRLTRLGLLASRGATTRAVAAQLTDPERLRRARVHPLAVLVALRTYASGRSVTGGSEWQPVAKISDALDAAFSAAFASVEPTGKRTLLALDVSGSMGASVAGLPLTCLDDTVRAICALPFGATDCSLPMKWALERGLPVDTFQVFTDNDTWSGGNHPHRALARYREATGIPARLAVVAMTATPFTIADPTDPGMLDVVGLDTATPGVLADFSRGEV